MRVQFSSIFLNGLLLSAALLPLSRPASHWWEALLAAVLGIFFLNSKHWWAVTSVRRILGISLAIIFVTVLAAVLAVPTGDLVYVSQLGLVILALPLVMLCINRYGSRLVGLCFLSMLLLHAQWGIMQFVLQEDLGLRLIGESVISPTQNAVAKFTLQNETLIRAYGPYAHANTFGGAMLIALILLVWLLHKKFLFSHQIYFRASWLLVLLGLLLSFSRAIYLGAILAVILSLFFFRVRLGRVSLISFIVIISFLSLLQARLTDEQDPAGVERARGFAWWGPVTGSQPLWHGVGPGQYSLSLKNYLSQAGIPHEKWEIAPVHSVPLLLASEWGFILAALVAIAAVWLLVGSLWLLPLLPPLLLDHYFITQPAALFLLLVVGLCLTERVQERALGRRW